MRSSRVRGGVVGGTNGGAWTPSLGASCPRHREHAGLPLASDLGNVPARGCAAAPSGGPPDHRTRVPVLAPERTGPHRSAWGRPLLRAYPRRRAASGTLPRLGRPAWPRSPEVAL